jgi:hypothetical protein
MQNNIACRTTDRITGRATSRGHTESLEHENAALISYLLELQEQMREHGLEPKQPPEDVSSCLSNESRACGSRNLDTTQSYDDRPRKLSGSSDGQAHTPRAALPHFRAGCVGDNYLGVIVDIDGIGLIEGTSLSLFGTKIDLAEFTAGEEDLATSPMSYRTFLRYAFGGVKPDIPSLPNYEKCKLYADWYFRSYQAFFPILCRRDFAQLLQRIFTEQYRPSSAEIVIVHMLLSCMDFQIWARNSNEQCHRDSIQHYHFAISFVPELIASHTLEDIQALTMICAHLRCQPRPGAAWWFTDTVLSLAIESGLHRSASAWSDSSNNHSLHHLEMRKRVFWSLLFIHSLISARLGRPMALRPEDFDIEVPQAIDDDLPSDVNLSSWRKCTYRAGVEVAKLMPTYIRIYSTMYAINTTGQYEVDLKKLGNELDDFETQRPMELRVGEHTKDEARVSALYLDILIGECQLLLHHPIRCRTQSPDVVSRNLDKCLTWNKKILAGAVQLKKFKSLDTSGLAATVLLIAIFTTLFITHQRRKELTQSTLDQLKLDMDLWLDVLGEVGHLLGMPTLKVPHCGIADPVTGTGTRLQAAIKDVFDRSLAVIGQDIYKPVPTPQVAVAQPIQTTTSRRTHSLPLEDAADHKDAAFVPSTSAHKTSMLAFSGHVPEQKLFQQEMHNQAQFAFPQSFGIGTRLYSEPNLADQMSMGEIELGIGATMAAVSPQSRSSHSSLQQRQLQDRHPSLQHLQQQPHHQQQQFQNSQLPSPTTVDFTNPFTPMPSNFTLSPPFEPQLHNITPHQPAVQAMFPHPNSAAWRQFADTIMHNMGQEQAYLQNMPTLEPYGGAAPRSFAGHDLDLATAQIASMSGMHLPLQDGGADQPWPLIQNANNPH